MDKFDVVIIGSGPGGYVAAIRAAQLGLKTAIVEKDKELGGTCLNIGCIPSKALLTSSDHFVFAKKEAAKHGIVLEKVGLDLATMLARKDKVVKTMNSGVKMLMKGNKITTFQGLGTITAPGRVAIKPAEGDSQEIEAKHIVVATGSIPVELANMKFDGDVIVSSTEALTFEKAPEKLVVIGGGAIGLELGSVWSRLGSDVTVLEFLPRIALGFDLELANLLQRSLTAQGMKFHLETKVSSVKVENGRAVATATQGDKELKFEADKVLVSVGRRAFAKGVFGEKLGVALDDRGRVKVDEHFRTNVEGIYAIGDVIAGPMLAHKAEEEGIACVEMIAGKAGHVNYDVIPGIIYTNPELAGAGVTEDFAKEKGDEGAHREVSFPREWAGGRERRCGRRGEIRRRRRDRSDSRRAHSGARRLGVDRGNRGGDGIRRQLGRSRPHRARASDVERSRGEKRAHRNRWRSARCISAIAEAPVPLPD